MKRSFLFISCTLLVVLTAMGQKFFFTQYGTAEGLPTDRVRMVAQDRLGFIWIATDKGLLRFDGKHLVDYSRHLDGRYIKALSPARTGELLLVSDTGIYALECRVDTAFVRQVVEAAPNGGDSLLHYPNDVLEDGRGRLWISQPNATVACWEAGQLSFFSFDKDHATGYSDSGFAFAEDAQGAIWAAATTGQLYRYDEKARRFLRVGQRTPLRRVHALRFQGDTLWMAGSGLRRLLTGPAGLVRRLGDYPTPGRELSSLIIHPQDGALFVATKNDGLFRAGFPGGQLLLQRVFGSNDPHRIEQLPFARINHLFVDREGSIWMSTMEGVGLLQTRFFESVFGLANNNTYVIQPAADGGVLLSFGDVFAIHPERDDYFGELLPNLDEGFITGIAPTPAGNWFSTTDGKLLLYRRRRIQRILDLSERGSGIFFLHGDQAGNVWFCQAPDERPLTGVARLDPDGRIRYYTAEAGLNNRILVIKESERGRLYAAGIGAETYLYRYQPETDDFINLSLSLPFAYSQGFEVHDLTIDRRGIVWLATTDGLLRYDLERIQRVDLGPLTANEVRAVASMPDGSLWLSTDTEGLLHYSEQGIVSFDEASGLPTTVMAYRCLTLDRRGRLWVGTAEGTVHSRDAAPIPLPTPAPRLLGLSSEAQRLPLRSAGPRRLPNNAGLYGRFVTLAYPGSDIDYQHRLLGRADTSWSAPSTASHFRYDRLPYGDYRLQLRARQPGGRRWSAPLALSFSVRQVWYKTWWAVSLFVLLGALLLYYVVYLNVEQLVRRIRALEGDLAVQRAAMHQKEQELQEKTAALQAKEHNLEAATAELTNQQEEMESGVNHLGLLHQLLRRIPHNASWALVLEAVAEAIKQTRGISAFEFGFYCDDQIQYEGFDRRRNSFTRRRDPFDEKSVLAVWALVRKEPVLIGDYRRDQARYVEPTDQYRFNSAIFLPFELAGRQQLVLCVYSIFKRAFDEQEVMLLQLLTDYLAITVKRRLGEEEEKN